MRLFASSSRSLRFLLRAFARKVIYSYLPFRCVFAPLRENVFPQISQIQRGYYNRRSRRNDHFLHYGLRIAHSGLASTLLTFASLCVIFAFFAVSSPRLCEKSSLFSVPPYLCEKQKSRSIRPGLHKIKRSKYYCFTSLVLPMMAPSGLLIRTW